MNSVRILATGGTIDKDHDPITESLIFSDTSHVTDMLNMYRIKDIACDVLMQKDSLDLNDTDRTLIKDKINLCAENAIVITHGTSTMSVTAEYLAKHINDKTIILTGALRPFSLFRSDAGFNLGSAISAARVLSNGVYITMNGQIFNAGHVLKNKDTGVFEGV